MQYRIAILCPYWAYMRIAFLWLLAESCCYALEHKNLLHRFSRIRRLSNPHSTGAREFQGRARCWGTIINYKLAVAV